MKFPAFKMRAIYLFKMSPNHKLTNQKTNRQNKTRNAVGIHHTSCHLQFTEHVTTLCMFTESLLNMKFTIDALKETVSVEDKDFNLKEYDVYLENRTK